MNGRHVNFTLIITMQYCMGIPPNLRTNVDYVFICREPKVCNQKRLYEHYAGMFPTFQMFREVLNQCTANYGCLVIDNNAQSSKLEDQAFWYRAQTSHSDWDTFRMCSEVYWTRKKDTSSETRRKHQEEQARIMKRSTIFDVRKV